LLGAMSEQAHDPNDGHAVGGSHVHFVKHSTELWIPSGGYYRVCIAECDRARLPGVRPSDDLCESVLPRDDVDPRVEHALPRALVSAWSERGARGVCKACLRLTNVAFE
jgi:hypothetical protein